MEKRSRKTCDEDIHSRNVLMLPIQKKRLKIGRNIKATSDNSRGLEQKLLFP